MHHVRGEGGVTTPRLAMQPGIRILDWLFPEGVVTNKAAAEDGSPCMCLGDVCFHSGVVGPMRVVRIGEGVADTSSSMLAEGVCNGTKQFEDPIAPRVKLFQKAAGECPKVTEGTTLEVLLEDVLPCICAKLKEGGLEVC